MGRCETYHPGKYTISLVIPGAQVTNWLGPAPLIGSLKSRADIIAENYGENIDPQILNLVPEPAWSCCLERERYSSCEYRNRPHSPRAENAMR